MGGFFEKPRQDRRAATAALAREGSVAGFTARALASARPRRPAKKDLWSSSAAARASRSYLCVLSAVYISWARMVWTCVWSIFAVGATRLLWGFGARFALWQGHGVEFRRQNVCQRRWKTTSSFTFALQWL